MKELIEITNGQEQLDEVAELNSKGLERLMTILHDMTYAEASQHLAALATDDEKPAKKSGSSKKGAASKQSKKAALKQSLRQAKSLQDVLQAVEDSKEQEKKDWF